MDYRSPGSSVHGIFQARVLEWVAMPSSKGIFPTQGLNPSLLCLLYLLCWQANSLPLGPLRKPIYTYIHTFFLNSIPIQVLPGSASGKESTCQWRRCRRYGFNPWVKKIPWRRKPQPTLVFLPGRFNEQRSLVGYSPRGCKKLDKTE